MNHHAARRPVWRIPSLAILTAAVAAAALLDAPASAQPGGQRGGRQGWMMRGPGGPPGFRQALQPEFLRRDLTLIVDELRLDESQGTVAEALLRDYDSAFTDAADEMRDRLGALRPQTEEDVARRAKRDELRQQMRTVREQIRDQIRAIREKAGEGGEIDRDAIEKVWAQMEPLRDQMRDLRPPQPEGEELARLEEEFSKLSSEWRATRAALRAEFLGNLQAILNEEQAARWGAFQMALRRDKSIERGRLSGEDVDLFIVLREIGIGDEQMWDLEDALDAYAIALDQALVARNGQLDESGGEVFAAMRSGDQDKVKSLMEREARLRTAVRSVNEQYVEIIAAELTKVTSAATAEEFRQAYNRRAYPRVFRTTFGVRSFDAAKSIEGLDDETLAAIVSLEESYLADLAVKNGELVQIIKKNEPERDQQRMEWVMARMNGGEGGPPPWRRGGGGDGEQGDRPPDPIRDAYQTRRELDERYVAQLIALLTPEQADQLPTQERGGPGGGFGRGGWGGPNADPAGPGGDMRDRAEQRRARMIEQFDRDGDGQLSDEERQAAREARRARQPG